MKVSKPIHRTRLVRILALSAVIITVTSIGLHLWFKYNARRILKEYISEQSHGKIKLELSELDLDLFLNKVQIREADLISTDSIHEAITYHVKFRKLTIRVASVWALLFKNQLLFDSIKLHDPVIDVMQWKKDTTHARAKDELSIPQEMGKVYHSMLNALDEFGIQRIIINNAQIRLINKLKPGSEPVTVSKIYFDLSRPPKVETAEEKNQQKIDFRTTNQNIALPGGRHRLSFSSFRLQLFRQRIEFDSCTITALATDTSRSNYKIFFSKLLLSGVDFNAMSVQNVIRADSVYCEQPYFDFDLYRSITAKKKKGMPDVQKIISELSGNLDLAFVGIKNAGIHFNVHGRSDRSFYNSNKDNFEMHDFRINPDSSEPATIKRLEMTLRDYHLFNGDSSSSLAFDSLHLLNNRIALNNFSASSRSGRSRIRSELNITVPYFELTDLDWSQLLFDQKIAAEEASMMNPEIFFRKKDKPRTGKKFNLYTALENIDTLVELNKVSIVKGNLDMKMNAATSFNIQNLDLGLQSNKMLASTSRAGIRRAIEHMEFSGGVIRVKNITAKLQHAKFTGNNQLYTDRLSITSIDNSVSGVVNDAHIDDLVFDEARETIELQGLAWNSATLSLNAKPSNSKKNNNSIHFKNIRGSNTQLNYVSGPLTLSTYIRSINLSSLEKEKQLKMEGLNISGNELQLKKRSMNVSATGYDIGNMSSSIQNLHISQQKNDTLLFSAPFVTFSTDLNQVISGNLFLNSLALTEPVIQFAKWNVPTNDTTGKPPAMKIGQLTATRPEINITIHRNDSVTVFDIPRSTEGSVTATDIDINGKKILIGTLGFYSPSVNLVKQTGEFGIHNGNLNLQASDISSGTVNGKNNWSFWVNSLTLQDSSGIYTGKNTNLRFKNASIGNLRLASDKMDLGNIIRSNISAWLKIPQGEYSDSITTFKWFNASYDNKSGTMKLDSFSYHPTLSAKEAIAKSPYQFDYTSFHTGPVSITGLKADQYREDTSFIADSISISGPVMNIYRDKSFPDAPHKKVKPLPVSLVKNIKIPVSINKILFTNGEIVYTEKNAKSGQEGTLLLTNLSGGLQNIRNREIAKDDSMVIRLKGLLLDSACMDISVKQSYTDTSRAFVMNAVVEPTPLTFLNPLIVPLSNVKLLSGVLDSFSMRAIGTNDVALGEMKMFYHHLRIKLVKDGDPDRSPFMQDLISILANALLIRDNNTQRTGVIFLKRDHTISFPKYILKMTLSGAASSVGVKRNKKYLDDYYRAVGSSKIQ